MILTEVDPENHKREYGIYCTRVYPTPQVPAPFGSTWCLIEGDGSTLTHSHQEGESFFIYSGKGEMEISGFRKTVKSGDVVHIPPHSKHQLSNLSKSEPIEFISVYWDTEHEFTPTPATLVAIAPPTPNGDLHLGHLAGPYVASDIYTRSLRLRNVPTHLMTGSDDHQSYVPVKARKLNRSHSETADFYTQSIQTTFQKAFIGVDTYLRPLKDPDYQAFIQTLFQKLVSRNIIEKKENKIYYCEPCQIYLYEAYLSGNCPHCHIKTNAFGCEACGHYNIGSDLEDPKCNQCSGIPTLKTLKQFVLPLANFHHSIDLWQKKTILSDRLRSYGTQVLQKGLPEIPVSLPGNWGIRAEPIQANSQVLYEWFEMAGGYLYQLEKLKASDPNFSGTINFELFFGFDNAFFYLNLIPAILMASESKVLPTALFTNEFYLLENSKFSTSRNHAIWANSALEILPPDALRFHLAHHRPESSQTNFTLEELSATFKQMENLCDAILHKIEGLNFPTREGLPMQYYPSHVDFQKQMDKILIDFAKAYDRRSFSTRSATRAFIAGMESLDTFINIEGLNSELDPERTLIANELILSALNCLYNNLYPVMPNYASQVMAALGTEGEMRLYTRYHRHGNLNKTSGLPSFYFRNANIELTQFNRNNRNSHAH